MNDTYVTVIGNLVADPVQRLSKNGDRPFAAFRIASTPRRRDNASGGFVMGATSFISVIAFNSLGANALLSLHKGDSVIVHGRMRVAEWTTQDGRELISVEVDAQHVGHDLTWGRTTFTKVRGSGWSGTDRTDDDGAREALAEVSMLRGGYDDRPEADDRGPDDDGDFGGLRSVGERDDADAPEHSAQEPAYTVV